MDPIFKLDLNEFVSQSRSRLKRILDRLEWSEDATVQDFNSNSVASSLKKVAKTPRSPSKASYPDSCNTINSLVLGTSELQNLLDSDQVRAPSNFRELQENFSRDQKLKIYEHVIGNTVKQENVSTEPKVEGETSLAEILAQKKREEKSKKRRFRKSKPTHIEEVRCLVNLQMQSLQQFMENKLRKDEFCRPITTGSLKFDGQREKQRSSHGRNRFEDYYGRESNREKFSINQGKITDQRHHRSRSKEYRRYGRSSSREIPSIRKKGNIEERRKHTRSSSKGSRRRRSRSREKRIHYEETSNCRKRGRSCSEERYGRSYNYETYKEDTKYKSIHSYPLYSRREDNDYDYHYSTKVRNVSYYELPVEESYNYPAQYSRATERIKNNYCSEESKSTKSNTIHEEDKYRENKTHSKRKKEAHKKAKRKKKKHKKRDHS